MHLTKNRRLAAFAAAATTTLALATSGAAISAGSAGASGTPGVTSTSVTIGATVPLSGIADGYASVSGAAAAVFKYVNAEHGGINGRTINYIRLDDCYGLYGIDSSCTASGSTLTETEDLLSTPGGLLATVGSLGTSAQEGVISTLEEADTPQLFVNSGDNLWDQPGTYPSLFGFEPSYTQEAKIFGSYIKSKYGSSAKVGFLGQSDFGPEALAGIEDEGFTPVNAGNSCADCYYNVFDSLTGHHSDIPGLVTDLKNDHATVVVLYSVPPITTAILASAHKDHYAPHWVISSIGSDPTSVKSVYEAGATTLTYFPGTTSTSTWNTWLKKVLEAYPSTIPGGFTKKSQLTGNEQYGACWAVAFLEALQSLGSNITQAGLTAAMTSTAFQTESLDPLSYSATNHEGLTGGVLAVINKASGSKPPTAATVKITGQVVYSTTDNSSPTVVKSTATISPIPTYIK